MHGTRRSRAVVVGAVITVLVAGVAVTASAAPGFDPGSVGQPVGDSVTTIADSVAPPREPLIFGTAAPTKANLQEQEAIAGRHIAAVRIYRQWGDQLFGPDQIWERDTYHTLFVSIKPRRADGSVVLWKDIGAAQPGDPLYSDMQDMAQQIIAFGDRVYLTLSHEPEASAGAFGTPADFVAAFRNFVTVMRAEHANVRPVAIFTGYGFKRTDGLNVDNFYPGDDYVTAVGVDLYNWGDCRNKAWVPLSQILDSARQWGLSHPTVPLLLTEWGSVEDPSNPDAKAQWITDSAKLLESPGWEQFTGLFAWGALHTQSTACPFGYDTSQQAEAAWAAVGQDPMFDAWE
jgi:hypothetical protein